MYDSNDIPVLAPYEALIERETGFRTLFMPEAFLRLSRAWGCTEGVLYLDVKEGSKV